jgi:antibiotic biosynthesis monooxygenase (ABM) superfamily enzyme
MVMAINPHEIVTFIVTHEVKIGKEPEYESWLHEIGEQAKQFEGHLGTNVIKPASTKRKYTIIIRFDRYENLEKWVQSETRKTEIAKISPVLETGDQFEIQTGIDFWFTPPESMKKMAPPFKQFLVTLSAIYPLTILIPWGFSFLFAVSPIPAPMLIRTLCINIVIVGLMVYVIMPHYTRLISKWLYV